MTGHDNDVLRIARALDELRGLDSSLVHELNLSADDLIGTCKLVAMVLAGYALAPQWVQEGLIATGAMVTSGLTDPEMIDFLWRDAKARDAKKKLGML